MSRSLKSRSLDKCVPDAEEQETAYPGTKIGSLPTCEHSGRGTLQQYCRNFIRRLADRFGVNEYDFV